MFSMLMKQKQPYTMTRPSTKATSPKRQGASQGTPSETPRGKRRPAPPQGNGRPNEANARYIRKNRMSIVVPVRRQATRQGSSLWQRYKPWGCYTDWKYAAAP